MSKIVLKYTNNILLYVAVFFLFYALWCTFGIIATSYIALISLVGFAVGFLASITLLYRIKNPFIPLILLMYLLASADEVNSKVYMYTTESYKLWNIGNWTIYLVVGYEIYKLIKEIRDAKNKQTY